VRLRHLVSKVMSNGGSKERNITPETIARVEVTTANEKDKTFHAAYDETLL